MNQHLLFRLLAFLLCVAGAAGLPGQTRDDLMRRSQDKHERQDFDGAIADLTEVINRNKEDGEAIYLRGCAKHGKGEVDSAIIDYTRAISLLNQSGVPSEAEKFWLAQVHANRGKAKLDQLDFAGSIPDFDAALKHQPENLLIYAYRSSVRQITGNLTAALADSEEMIRRAPDRFEGYQQRAVTRAGQGDFAGAIADFRQVGQREPEHAAYSHYFIWCLMAKQGKQGAADDELTAHLKAKPATGEWEPKIGEFLLGRLSEADFAAATVSPEAMRQRAQECEAWYYRGMRKLAAGDRATARSCFDKAKATGMLYLTEYVFACMELATKQ